MAQGIPFTAAAAMSAGLQTMGSTRATKMLMTRAVSTMPICLLAVVPPIFCMTMPWKPQPSAGMSPMRMEPMAPP
jgi:hypothetical protein